LFEPPLGGHLVDAEGEVKQRTDQGHEPGEQDPEQGGGRVTAMQQAVQTQSRSDTAKERDR
jgi:hypothetical protein